MSWVILYPLTTMTDSCTFIFFFNHFTSFHLHDVIFYKFSISFSPPLLARGSIFHQPRRFQSLQPLASFITVLRRVLSVTMVILSSCTRQCYFVTFLPTFSSTRSFEIILFEKYNIILPSIARNFQKYQKLRRIESRNIKFQKFLKI